MDSTQAFLTGLLSLSVAALKVSEGASSTLDDLLYVVRRPALLARAFIAVDVIPSVFAIALAAWLPLEPAVKAGIVLMGLTPVPPLVPGKEVGAIGRKEYAHGIHVALSLLALPLVPVVFSIAIAVFDRSDAIPLGVLTAKILGGILTPLAIGAIVGRLAPALSQRLVPWINRLGFLSMAIAFAAILLSRWPAIALLIGNGTLLAMIAMVGITLAGGHLLGGPEPRDRATLAFASAARHPGMAILIAAGSSFANASIDAAVLLYTAVGISVSGLYKLWFHRGASRREHQPA
jgi:BASS family bile acid:Na+ symporter